MIISLELIILGCSKNEDSSSTNASNGVSELNQVLGSDGKFVGSFQVPPNGISFLLSIFKENNDSVYFYSLTDPDGVNILSSTSNPNLYFDASGSLGENGLSKNGYSNILVPQSPNFSAKEGTWIFKAKNNDSVKIMLRSGTNPSSTTIEVQPYITGTNWSTNDLDSALSILKDIYTSSKITLTVNNTIIINDYKYTEVSNSFTDSITSELVSKGDKDSVNLFFIEDFKNSSNILGVAAGIPGSMGIVNSWNGVLISLSTHATGNSLDSQLLGETAAHEMGHQLGLFHTTEAGGTIFDIIDDTAECSITRDNNSSGIITAEECEDFGGDNVMFWTSWSSSSRTAGKKQNNFSNQQIHVLKNSPIGK